MNTLNRRTFVLTFTIIVCGWFSSFATGQVELYIDEQRITDPRGLAEFCCLVEFQSLANYKEDGLRVHVDDSFHPVPSCIGTEHYYPLLGAFSRVNISRADGGVFDRLEMLTSTGFIGDIVYLWITPYQNGSALDHLTVDVPCGTYIGLEGDFDSIRIGSYFNESLRDEMNENTQNAIVLDNVLFEGSDSTDCLEMQVTPMIAGEITHWNISSANANAPGVVVWGTESGRTTITDYFGYCAAFDIADVERSNVVGLWHADESGNATVSRRVRGRLIGTEVFTQAAQGGTCPLRCASGVKAQIIQ